MAAVLDAMQDREYAIADQVSVADVAPAYTRDWADELELLQSFPRLKAYMQAMYARPNAPARIAQAMEGVQPPR